MVRWSVCVQVAGTECSGGGDAQWSVICICVSDGTRGAGGLEAGYQSGLSGAGQGWIWVGSRSARTVDQICKKPGTTAFYYPDSLWIPVRWGVVSTVGRQRPTRRLQDVGG